MRKADLAEGIRIAKILRLVHICIFVAITCSTVENFG